MPIPEEIIQLEARLAATTDPKEQAEIILAIVRKYNSINSIDGGPYIEKLLILAKELGSKEYEAWGHLCKGNIYRNAASFNEAIEEAEKARLLFTSLNDLKGQASCYTMLGHSYQGLGDYPEAISMNRSALKIWEEIGDKYSMAQSYNNIGTINRYQGNYRDGLSNYAEALRLRTEISDKHGIADSYNNIGSIYINMGNFPEALSNYLAGLKLKEEIGDKLGIATAYVNIGLIHQKQGNYSEALSSQRVAIRICQEIGERYVQAAAYMNIGNVYYLQADYQEALSNHSAALEIMTEVGNKTGIALSYSNIGRSYFKLGDNSLSLSNHFSALRVGEEIGFKEVIAESYISIGTNYTAMREYKMAADNLAIGLRIAEEIGAAERIQSALRSWYELKKAEQDGMAALDYHERFVALEKKMNNEESAKKIAGMQFGYQIEKKEQEVAFERQKKEALQTAYDLLDKEKQRSEALLLNILPSEVADELKEKGAAEAKLFDNVTVLFTDFKNFTTISERLTPQQIVNELHECFKAFDEIMERYNIEKIKTMGDAYMAVSGLPTANPNHAEDMVKAALEIRDLMDARRAAGRAEIFEVRIGIHSGHVVAGIVGVKKFAYDIWGDTVNTAARMEQHGEAGKVNISEVTYGLVRDKFKYEYRGEVEAKNKGKLKMYFVDRP